MARAYPQHILEWRCDSCGLKVNAAVMWNWDEGEPSREGQFPSCSWCYADLRLDGELYQPTLSLDFTELVAAAQADHEEKVRKARRERARDKRQAARREAGVPEVVRVTEAKPDAALVWDRLVDYLHNTVELAWERRKDGRAAKRLAATGSAEKQPLFVSYTSPRPLRNFFRLAARLFLPGQEEASHWARMDGEVPPDDPVNLSLDSDPLWVGRSFKITPYGYRSIPDSEANADYHAPRKVMLAKEAERRRSLKARAKRRGAERLRREEAAERATQSQRNYSLAMRLLDQLRARLFCPGLVAEAA